MILRDIVNEARKARIRQILSEAIRLQEMTEEDFLSEYEVDVTGDLADLLVASHPTCGARPPVVVRYDQGKPGLQCRAKSTEWGVSSTEWFFGPLRGLADCLSLRGIR